MPFAGPSPPRFLQYFQETLPLQFFEGRLGDEEAPAPFSGNLIDLFQNFFRDNQMRLYFQGSLPMALISYINIAPFVELVNRIFLPKYTFRDSYKWK